LNRGAHCLASNREKYENRMYLDEIMNMVRKGQMRGVEKGDSMGQIAFITRLFGVAV